MLQKLADLAPAQQVESILNRSAYPSTARPGGVNHERVEQADAGNLTTPD